MTQWSLLGAWEVTRPSSRRTEPGGGELLLSRIIHDLTSRRTNFDNRWLRASASDEHLRTCCRSTRERGSKPIWPIGFTMTSDRIPRSYNNAPLAGSASLSSILGPACAGAAAGDELVDRGDRRLEQQPQTVRLALDQKRSLTALQEITNEHLTGTLGTRTTCPVRRAAP